MMSHEDYQRRRSLFTSATFLIIIVFVGLVMLVVRPEGTDSWSMILTYLFLLVISASLFLSVLKDVNVFANRWARVGGLVLLNIAIYLDSLIAFLAGQPFIVGGWHLAGTVLSAVLYGVIVAFIRRREIKE